jgi:hypothetical protein
VAGVTGPKPGFGLVGVDALEDVGREAVGSEHQERRNLGIVRDAVRGSRAR